MPEVDDHQDYELLEGWEKDNQTILRFSRKLITCDPDDYTIDVSIHVLRHSNTVLKLKNTLDINCLFLRAFNHFVIVFLSTTRLHWCCGRRGSVTSLSGEEQVVLRLRCNGVYVTVF